VTLLAVLVVWCALYLQRRTAHQPNVDDYLYASLSQKMYRAFATNPFKGVSAVLHSGETAPLVPLLASPLTRLDGVDGAVAVNLPLLVALAVGAYLLARRWVRPAGSAAIAAAAALNPAVLGWSQMFHFSVAATAATLWALAAYLHSDGFRRWRWSMATGVAVALLSLSRTLAIVYLAPLVLVMAAQAVIGPRRRHLRTSLLQIGAATLAALVIAGPWWATSGTTAIRRLRSLGYDSSAGFNTGSHGVVRSLYDRAQWTLNDLGSASRIALLVLGVVAIVVVVWRRHLGADGAAVVGWSIGCFALLASSSDPGTGFGLPVVAVLIVAVGAAVTQLPTRALVGAVAVAGLVTTAGIVGQVAGGEGSTLPGPIYRAMVLGTGAPPATNIDALHERFAAELESGPVVLVRDDNVLNANGLTWAAARKLYLLVPPHGPNGTAIAISELSRARFLITGSSPALYHKNVDQETVEAAARRQGFVLILTLELSPQNTVRLWRR
jgi:hypothetical protein